MGFIGQFGIVGAVVSLLIFCLSKLIPVMAVALASGRNEKEYITRMEYESRHQDIMHSLQRIENRLNARYER